MYFWDFFPNPGNFRVKFPIFPNPAELSGSREFPGISGNLIKISRFPENSKAGKRETLLPGHLISVTQCYLAMNDTYFIRVVYSFASFPSD